MSTREARIAEYERNLSKVYQPELDYLAKALPEKSQIINTGGGCMAIQALLPTSWSTGPTLELVATTADGGLAENRTEIVHWLVSIYDIEEGGEALASGHDTASLEQACTLALDNLRNNIPPADHCPCFEAD